MIKCGLKSCGLLAFAGVMVLTTLPASAQHDHLRYRYKSRGSSQSTVVTQEATTTAAATASTTTSQAEETTAVAPAGDSSYKRGTVLPLSVAAEEFVKSVYQWAQPDGVGTNITITYSYSNLLDGQIEGLTNDQIKQAIEESLALWASYAPLDFVEVEDDGPTPTASDSSYTASGRPQIRFGYHTIDGASGSTLAHSFYPYSETDGLAGDVHFDVDEDWSGAEGGYFLEVALHEIGHSLGLDHVSDVDAIMNPIIQERFASLGVGYLLQDDIDGIQDIYGAGVGSVTPLTTTDEDPTDEDPTTDDTTSNLAVTWDEETSQLTIAGTTLDDQALLFSWCGYVLVMGLDETTVNDSSYDLFEVGSVDIVCELGDGDDQLYLYCLRANDFTCYLGAGDDVLKVYYSWLSSFTADGGDDDDTWTQRISSLGDVVTSNFETEPTTTSFFRFGRRSRRHH